MSEQDPGLWQSYMKSRRSWEENFKEIVQILKVFQGIAYVVSWSLSMPALVLLHYRFGARFFRIVVVAGAIGAYWACMHIFRESTWGGPSEPSTAAVIGAWLCGSALAVHLIWVTIDINRGIEWHTRSSGMPLPLWRFLPRGHDPMTVERFYEPLLVIIVALILRSGEDPFWRAVLLSGGCLFVLKAIEFDMLRSQVLDQIDQRIEGEVMQELIEQKTSGWKTKGFTGAMTVVNQLKASESPDAVEILASRRTDAEVS